MIRIAVVEDDNIMRSIICEKINSCIKAEHAIELQDFASAEELLMKVEQEMPFHIVFSDIEMAGMNGIGMGMRLKKMCPSVYLVYLTSHANFAADSYCVEAYQYILKEQMETRLPKIVSELIQKIECNRKNYVIVGSSMEKKKVYYSDIICVQKKKGSKYVEVVTVKETFVERTSIADVIERLQSTEFVEVDRSCVINMRHIDGIKDNTIQLSNNKKVEMSRMRMTKVKQQINRFWGELE